MGREGETPVHLASLMGQEAWEANWANWAGDESMYLLDVPLHVFHTSSTFDALLLCWMLHC